MEMDAAVLHGPRDLQIAREPAEEPGPEEVMVQVAYCGVCPWDLRAYLGLSSSVCYPLHFGHEISGVVARIGDKVQGLYVGQPVVVDAIRRCGVCPACRRGLENHCQDADFSRGGFASLFVAPAGNVYPLRPSTPLQHAAMTEPLACVLHAQNRLSLAAGGTALVMGCGPLGLLHLQVLRLSGVRVLAADPVAFRREAALRLGASAALDPMGSDLTGAVREHTGGWGVEAAIVATGAVAAAQQATDLLAFEGKLLLFAGVHPKAPLTLDPNDIHYRESWITGSSDYVRREFRQALELIEQETLQLHPLLTDSYALAHLAEALARVQSGQALKVMVRCGDVHSESRPAGSGTAAHADKETP
jgi:L-iditol 2-dehydrogenase